MTRTELKEFKESPTAHRILEYNDARIELRRPATETKNTMSIEVVPKYNSAITPNLTATEVRDFIRILQEEFLRE
ncbi:MAG: hypothetical protein ABR981_00275 [Candidatus Micrarchaeaceae archaeon]